MKRITITKGPTGYNATMHQDAEVFALFGTYTIPTAFTANAPIEKVVARIQELNPDREVIAA